MSDKRVKWYVVYIYVGYENKVKVNLEKIIENRNLFDRILDIRIFIEFVIEIKDGKKIVKEKKKFFLYVLIKVVMDNEIWYMIRNVRGVIGFVGFEFKFIFFIDEEIEVMGIKEEVVEVFDIEVGDNVKVVFGLFIDFYGLVVEINREWKKVKVMFNLFGREIFVEFDYY